MNTKEAWEIVRDVAYCTPGTPPGVRPVRMPGGKYSPKQYQDACDVLDEAINPTDLWGSDLIQFARLLCEISATQIVVFSSLCDSMNLDRDDIGALFDRADAVWERAKEDRT